MPGVPMSTALQKSMLLAQAHIRKYAANFQGYDEFEDPTRMGSATFVDVKGKTFVATAGHNINDGRRFPTHALAYLQDRPDDRGWRPVRTTLRGGDGDVDEEWDLACVECHDALLAKVGRQALDFSRLDTNWRPSSSPVFIYGLTEDRVDQSGMLYGKPYVRAGENGYLTRPADLATIRGATIRPDIDLFLELPQEMSCDFHGNIGAPLSTIGMSGGGVWAVNADESGFWDPNMMRLVAVIRTTFAKEGWVRATLIKHWVDLLEEHGRSKDAPSPLV